MRGGGGNYIYVEKASAIWPLIVLNVIIFVLTEIGTSGQLLQNMLMLHPYYIRHWELWRLVTYMFAHGGFIHIFSNMLGIYMFGRPVEKLLGVNRFLVLYFLSGILGGLVWLLFNWSGDFVALVQGADKHIYQVAGELLDEALQDNSYKLRALTGGCVGASGGVYGILVAAGMAFPNAIVMLLIPPIPMKMRTMVIIYIIVEIFGSANPDSHVAHIAHLGGALGAFVYMRRLRGGYGPTLWQRFIGWIYSLRAPRIRQVRNEPKADDWQRVDSDWNGAKEKQLLAVLEKIAKEGYDRLSDEELKILAEASKRVKDKK